jgi:hypothetical protein
MRAVGLPYSAMLRAGQPNVVTGLIWCSRLFVEVVGPFVDAYDFNFKIATMAVLDTAKRIPDERLLYQIIRDSGLPLPPRHNQQADPLGVRLADPANCHDEVFRPWHGVNVGAARGRQFGDAPRTELPFFQANVAWLWQVMARPAAKVLYDYMLPWQQAALSDILQSTIRRVDGWPDALDV